MSSVRPQSAARGFTLVELLVVIGIIALLISILLPALGKAREQGNTIKCLSNLRSIGTAAAMYTSTQKGTMLPGDVQDAKYPISLAYQDTSENWATILVADKYLPYPELTSTADPLGSDNVFRCPSGVLETSAVGHSSSTIPASRTDGQGAMACVTQSQRLSPGRTVYTWYGINSTNDTSIPTPFTRCSIDANGKVAAPGFRKQNEIKSPTEYVFLYDGLYGFNYCTTNGNRINARHGGKKFTNCAFVDGHAETIKTTTIPGEDKVATTGMFTLANCLKYPYPKWRLDQR